MRPSVRRHRSLACSRSSARSVPSPVSISSRRMPAPIWRVFSSAAALPGPASTSVATHSRSGSLSSASPPASHAMRALITFLALVFSEPLALVDRLELGLRAACARRRPRRRRCRDPSGRACGRRGQPTRARARAPSSDPRRRCAWRPRAAGRRPACAASSSTGMPASSAQLFRVRDQYSSSSSKSLTAPSIRNWRRRCMRSSRAASASSRSSISRSFSCSTLPSSSGTSRSRASLSTEVTIEAAK